MKLKPILITMFMLLLTYSAYWYYIAENAEKYLAEIIKDFEQDGFSLTYSGLEVEGYPYRLVLILSEPVVSSSHDNLESTWTSDKLNIYAHPWNFNHLILTANSSRLLVDDVVVDSRLTRLSINGSKNQQSRLSLELNEINSSKSEDNKPLFNADKLALHSRGATNEPQDSGSKILAPKLIDFAFGIEGLTIGGNGNDKKIDAVTMVSSLRGGVAPSLNQEGLEAWRDSGGTLEIADMDIIVGSFDLTFEGSVTIDNELKPLGALSTKIEGATAASEVLDRFVSLDQKAKTTLTSSLTLLEAFSDGGGIPLSLTAQNGSMWLGPLLITSLPPIISPAN